MKKLFILIILVFMIVLSSCSNTSNIIPPIEEEQEEIIIDKEEIKDEEIIIEKDEKIILIEEFLNKIYQENVKQIHFNTFNNINKSYSLLYFINIDELIIDEKLVDKKYKSTRPGITRDKIEWIVIHDTGNNKPTANGLNHSNYIQNSNPGLSWHYTVDEEYIYQHIPDNEVAYHAGDGLRPTGTKWYSSKYNKTNYGGGNLNGIGIETCVYSGIDYLETMVTTAKLAAKLLYKYNLPIESLRKHYDFSGKNCPQVLINSYYFPEFRKLTSYYLEAYKLFNDVEVEYICDENIKNYITEDGIIKDDILKSKVVEYKIRITYQGIEYIYEYQTNVN